MKNSKNGPRADKVTMTLPSDLIVELNPRISPEGETIPVLVWGKDIKIDVTDLMTVPQATEFCSRFTSACTLATEKKLVDGNFGIKRDD